MLLVFMQHTLVLSVTEPVIDLQEYSSSMDHGYILMYERQRPGERCDADADPFGGQDDELVVGAPAAGRLA